MKISKVYEMKNLYFLIAIIFLASTASISQTISVAVGGSLSHSVISGPGGVCGWGVNGNGQIGDNFTINRSTPVAVIITGTVTKVVAGKTTTLFLKSNGEVWGCGMNDVGQLGLGNRVQQNTPVQVMAGTTFTDIACGSDADHCLLLKNDGKVYAFGRNQDGELGTGPDGMSQYNSNATFGCPPPSTFCHPCTNSGALNNCEWGATANDLIAQPLWSGVCTSIWAGAHQSFFKKTDGTIWASGINTSGQLGDGSTTTPTSGPVSIGTFAANTVSKISVGYQHTLFLKTDGTVCATGANGSGQLGDNTTVAKSTPVQCTGLPAGTYIDIAAGAGYSIFLKSDNTVYVCGDNLYGQLGNAAAFPTSYVASPTLLSTISGVKAIATGSTSQSVTLFLKTDNTLWAAGYNVQGNLGNGTIYCGTCPSVPCPISGTICNGNSTPQQVSTGSGCLPGILPVELTSFNAECTSGIVQFKWSTASELNNDYFSIEQSENGITFKEIRKMKGAGTSFVKNNYEFIDELPVLSSSNSPVYYRLKQTDFDGKFEYFTPISVLCSLPDDWNLFFQNPIFDEGLKGTLLLPENSGIKISVIDLQGRIIKEEKLNAAKGSNLLRIELNQMENGIYFLRASNHDTEIVKKFVKF